MELTINIMCVEDRLHDLQCGFDISKCSTAQVRTAIVAANEAYQKALVDNLPPSAEVHKFS
jgi:hypothetical protein